MKSKHSKIGVILAGLLLSATAAQAATLDVSFNAPKADTGVPAASMETGAVYQSVTGSVAGIRRSPWEETDVTNGTYTSVSADSEATYTLDANVTALSLMWGSIDTYNTIQFFADGVATGEAISGQDVIDAGAPQGIGFAVVTISTDSAFDEIRILSEVNGFEFANLSY